jgi:hypothetical protein
MSLSCSFFHAYSIHFLENSKANAKVFNVVTPPLSFSIEPNLKMPTPMTLLSCRVSRRNYEIIYNYDFSAFSPCLYSSVVRWHSVFTFTLQIREVVLSEISKESKPIRSCIVAIELLRLCFNSQGLGLLTIFSTETKWVDVKSFAFIHSG